MSSSPNRGGRSDMDDIKTAQSHEIGHGLSQTQTISGMTISPELFEKLYITPKVPHVGDNYKRFANPTPLGFVGFVISTFTFSMVLMGWGGAQGLQGVVGIFFFVGPLLLTLACIFEWAMGNFFSVGHRPTLPLDAGHRD
ncbi:hypothetical protein LTR37_005162 [Vermiconidia calcicola]|uniref:Uncharacterized protein n=1 Tax=Vermiconidia calcicola TaxID=1690605 RepID=A0ACC3NKE9_9PEZI|nr:hypothetical protein LTR37_005162 [Vermiconidia calcicola]